MRAAWENVLCDVHTVCRPWECGRALSHTARGSTGTSGALSFKAPGNRVMYPCQIRPAGAMPTKPARPATERRTTKEEHRGTRRCGTGRQVFSFLLFFLSFHLYFFPSLCTTRHAVTKQGTTFFFFLGSGELEVGVIWGKPLGWVRVVMLLAARNQKC